MPLSPTQRPVRRQVAAYAGNGNGQHHEVRIDRTRIAELIELGGEGDPHFVQDLLERFIADAGTRMVSLKEAAAGDRWDEVKKIGHALKGSCMNLGLVQLADLCKGIEAAGAAEQQEEGKKLIAELEIDFADTVQVLQKDYLTAVPNGRAS